LIVWKDARHLTRKVYAASEPVPFRSDWGLREQIRRASVSVMSNIAEGFERSSEAQFRYFLDIAKASCGEVRSQLYVALDQQYIDSSTFAALFQQAEILSRRLHRLAKAGSAHPIPPIQTGDSKFPPHRADHHRNHSHPSKHPAVPFPLSPSALRPPE